MGRFRQVGLRKPEVRTRTRLGVVVGAIALALSARVNATPINGTRSVIPVDYFWFSSAFAPDAGVDPAFGAHVYVLSPDETNIEVPITVRDAIIGLASTSVRTAWAFNPGLNAWSTAVPCCGKAWFVLTACGARVPARLPDHAGTWMTSMSFEGPNDSTEWNGLGLPGRPPGGRIDCATGDDDHGNDPGVGTDPGGPGQPDADGIQTTPEPGTIILLGIGLAAAGWLARKRQQVH